MATLLFCVFLHLSEITMNTATGWEGLAIVAGYILTVFWDFSAIMNIFEY